MKSLEAAASELEIGVLESYALRMESKSLYSRLGYLLERLGIESAALLAAASSAYVKLDPARPRRGTYNSKWRVLDNLGGVG